MIGQSIQTKVYFVGCVIRRHASFRTLVGELNLLLLFRFGFVHRFLVSCFSFDSPGNQAVAKRVLCEVRSLYSKGKWKKAVIRGEHISLIFKSC